MASSGSVRVSLQWRRDRWDEMHKEVNLVHEVMQKVGSTAEARHVENRDQ